MPFMKKPSTSVLNAARKSAGYREREALDKCYARVPVKTGSGTAIKFLFWSTDHRGKKSRDSAVYLPGRGWIG